MGQHSDTRRGVGRLLLICDEKKAVVNNDQSANWNLKGDKLYVTISDSDKTYQYQIDSGNTPTLKLLSSSDDGDATDISYSRISVQKYFETLQNIQPNSADYTQLLEALYGEWQKIGDTDITGNTYFLLHKSEYLLAKVQESISSFINGAWTPAEEIISNKEGTWQVDGNKLTFVFYGGDKREYLFAIHGQYLMISSYTMKDNPIIEWDYFYKIPGSDEFRTHLYYAPLDFDESTATMDDAAIYLSGKWTPEDENNVPGNFPGYFELGSAATSSNGGINNNYVVTTADGSRGAWFVKSGRLVLSFDSMYNDTYYYDISDRTLTLTRSFTDGTTHSVTYIRD